MIISFMRHLAKCYGVKLIMSKKGYEGIRGCADCKARAIILYPGWESDTDLLSTFFHELAHIYSYEMNIHTRYHKGKTCSWKTAYRAECNTDRIGAYFMKCYFPDLKFDAFYLNNPRAAKAFLKMLY
jgi:hypothetical protein